MQPLDEPVPSTSDAASHAPVQAPGGTASAAEVLPSGGGFNLNLNFFTDDNIPGLSSSEDEDDETESSE